jgi:adenosine deaminase/aminodeoxyfutalosine deaminase
MNPDSLRDFIRRLPKAELHLHLEGTIQPATVVELSRRHDALPMTLAEAEALYQFTDFTGFINSFRTVTSKLITPEDYALVATRMMEELAAQGVVHAEVYISVGVIYLWRKHAAGVVEPIFAALEAARKEAAARLGISLYWIFDAVRHFSVEEAERVFEDAARLRAEYPALIGIGLGGDERQRGSAPFKEHYAKAARAGLRLTNHAGETTGPEAIREALEIESERIGHALSLIHDPQLMEELRAKQIPLELNPSSNVRTGQCANFAAHPLRRYFDAGLLVTLNSDDPAFFGCSIENEFYLAHTEQGFTREELRQLAANSFKSSFLPEAEKQMWLARVAAT